MEINFFDIKERKNIIDIRDEYIYQQGHIPNSINIPYNYLLQNCLKLLNQQEVYYIYCSQGNKSKKISKILNQLGYHCYSIIGGYNNYKTMVK